MSSIKMDDIAVKTFQEYLRINTMQPNPDYPAAVSYLTDLAKELGLECHTVHVLPNKPIVIMKWPGEHPEMQSIMLNSHMDVVPVFPEFWKYDPFQAVIDEKGDIYGRGTQDMKCVGVQYLEAIRRLKKNKPDFKPKRNIFVTFVPDEEIGGILGMQIFVDHPSFKELNVGFSLDEGIASPSEVFSLFYGERSVWWVKYTAKGQPGHGSQFLPNTAGKKIHYLTTKMFEWRDKEEAKLKANPKFTLGDVTTVNLTKLDGGVQYNVVPAELVVGFDVRITPTFDCSELEGLLHKWAKEADEYASTPECPAPSECQVTFEFLQRGTLAKPTDLNPDHNPWWAAFSKVCDDLKMSLRPQIFPAATDGRFLRAKGIPVIGFSPMNHTPILLHDHNEFLNKNIFLKGVDFYYNLLPVLANCSAS